MKGREATTRGAAMESPVSGRLSNTLTVCSAPSNRGSALLLGGAEGEGLQVGSLL